MLPGRYALRLTKKLGYEVDVPDTRFADEGVYLHTPESPGVFAATTAGATTRLPRHPCTDMTGVPVGPGAADLANAVAAQPDLVTSKPKPVTLGGASGYYLELRIPADDEGSTCGEGLQLFSTGTTTWSWGPGLARWWILDLHGERVVVMNFCDADLQHERTCRSSRPWPSPSPSRPAADAGQWDGRRRRVDATPDLDELYAASYRRLVVQLFALCGDMADAEDAVQEAFVIAIRKRRRVMQADNPEAWVRTVAVNRLHAGWRHADRRPQVPAPGARTAGPRRGRARARRASPPPWPSSTTTSGWSWCSTTWPTSAPRRSPPSSASPRAP